MDCSTEYSASLEGGDVKEIRQSAYSSHSKLQLLFFQSCLFLVKITDERVKEIE